MEKKYITHKTSHGRVDTFEVVNCWPSNYTVWAIGRQNFPFDGWLPLCKYGHNEEPWQRNIDLTSLKAIKVRDEETALRCLDAAVRGEAESRDDFMRIMEDVSNSEVLRDTYTKVTQLLPDGWSAEIHKGKRQCDNETQQYTAIVIFKGNAQRGLMRLTFSPDTTDGGRWWLTYGTIMSGDTQLIFDEPKRDEILQKAIRWITN